MNTTSERPAAVELSPSDVQESRPVLVRLIGLIGLALAVLGTTAVVANQFKPVWISEGWGYALAALGLAGLIVHAIRESDVEYRRVYGVAALVMLVVAVVIALVPGKPKSAPDTQLAEVGYYLLPWGVMLGLLSLVFLVIYVRNETDDFFRRIAEYVLLGGGGTFAVLAAVLAIGWPTAAIVPAVAVGIVSLGFLCGYFGSVDPATGIGRIAVIALGVLGGLVTAYAVGRAIVPQMLFDGPKALQRPDGALDIWNVLGRSLMVIAALSGVLPLLTKAFAPWVRYALALVGFAFAVAFVVASVASPLSTAPTDYLVPGGIVTAFLGLALVAVALAVGSDATVVVLARRELASYFFSPVVYVVLFGATVVAIVGQSQFVLGLIDAGAIPEPILGSHFGLTLAIPLAVPFIVPALTMGTLSEERRTGTLEVLMTAPVREWEVVTSKFVSALLAYMITWLPAAFLLFAMQTVNGVPFDLRPLLSYFLAVFACGLNFVAFGVLASSFSRNQLVAAIVTFAYMFFQLMLVLAPAFKPNVGAGGGLEAVIEAAGKLSYLNLWQRAVGGQLEVLVIVVQASLAAVWLFLTAKVLEARKWV